MYYFSDTKFITLLCNMYSVLSQGQQVYETFCLPRLSTLAVEIAQTNEFALVIQPL